MYVVQHYNVSRIIALITTSMTVKATKTLKKNAITICKIIAYKKISGTSECSRVIIKETRAVTMTQNKKRELYIYTVYIIFQVREVQEDTGKQ